MAELYKPPWYEELIDDGIFRSADEYTKRVYKKNYNDLYNTERQKMALYLYALTNEVYQPIILDGVQTGYKVSSFGNITNGEGKILKPWITGHGNGYYCIHLKIDCLYKTCLVHRLVATAFIPNPENKPQVNHIDGNKLNNRADNLEWVTVNENMEHAVRTGLLDIKGLKHPENKYTEEQIRRVCELLEDVNNLPEQISKETGVNRGVIYNIMKGKTWTEISKEYNIIQPTEHRGRKYTDEQIERVCQLLCDPHTTFPEIESITGVGIATVADVSSGRSYKRLSKRYSFPNRDHLSGFDSCHTWLTEGQIHAVCQMLMNPHTKYKLISAVTEVPINCIQGIAKHKRWKEFADNYDFPARTKIDRDTVVKTTPETEIVEMLLDGFGPLDIADIVFAEQPTPDGSNPSDYVNMIKERYLLG